DHVDVNLPARQGLEFLAQPVHTGPAAPDDDAGLGGMHGDLHPVGGALDLNGRNAGGVKVLLDVIANLRVFLHRLGVVGTAGKPPGIPVTDDADPQSLGVNLLTHNDPSSRQEFVPRPASRPSPAA